MPTVLTYDGILYHTLCQIGTYSRYNTWYAVTVQQYESDRQSLRGKPVYATYPDCFLVVSPIGN